MKPGRNVPQYEAVVEMRRSSKAQPHDSRPRRQRTRQADRRADIRDHS